MSTAVETTIWFKIILILILILVVLWFRFMLKNSKDINNKNISKKAEDITLNFRDDKYLEKEISQAKKNQLAQKKKKEKEQERERKRLEKQRLQKSTEYKKTKLTSLKKQKNHLNFGFLSSKNQANSQIYLKPKKEEPIQDDLSLEKTSNSKEQMNIFDKLKELFSKKEENNEDKEFLDYIEKTRNQKSYNSRDEYATNFRKIEEENKKRQEELRKEQERRQKQQKEFEEKKIKQLKEEEIKERIKGEKKQLKQKIKGKSFFEKKPKEETKKPSKTKQKPTKKIQKPSSKKQDKLNLDSYISKNSKKRGSYFGEKAVERDIKKRN